LSAVVADAAGPVDAELRARLNGEIRARSAGTPGTRLVRIEGLEPDTTYRIELEADGAAAPPPDAHFPAEVTTLPAPEARETASFATLNDLHFGEPQFGGTLLPDGEYGPEAP